MTNHRTKGDCLCNTVVVYYTSWFPPREGYVYVMYDVYAINQL